MHINEDLLGRISVRVIEHLRKKSLIDPKAPIQDATQIVKEIFIKNFREEEQIEAEAEETMESLLKGRGEYDRRKMLLLLKNRIAKQRGFVL